MNTNQLRLLAMRMAMDRLFPDDRFYILRNVINCSGFTHESRCGEQADYIPDGMLYRNYTRAAKVIWTLKSWFREYPEETEVPVAVIAYGTDWYPYLNGWTRKEVRAATAVETELGFGKISLPEPHPIYEKCGPFGLPGRYADISAVPENGETQDRTYNFRRGKDDLSFVVNYEDDVFIYTAKDRKMKKDEKPCEKDNEKPEKPAKTGENCVKNDHVEHPKHYISASGLETIDVISAFTEGLDGEDAFCTGNAIKYLCRWPHKNGVEDLKKARWYIDRLIGTKEKSDKSDA